MTLDGIGIRGSGSARGREELNLQAQADRQDRPVLSSHPEPLEHTAEPVNSDPHRTFVGLHRSHLLTVTNHRKRRQRGSSREHPVRHTGLRMKFSCDGRHRKIRSSVKGRRQNKSFRTPRTKRRGIAK